MTKLTVKIEIRETGFNGKDCHLEAECPFCWDPYWEVRREWPGSFSTPPEVDIVEEGEGCRHLVDIDFESVTFCRFPRLFRAAVGLSARYRRSRLLRRLTSLRRKLLK